MKSDNVKSGMQQAPHRSLFNALGMTQEEMKKDALTFSPAAVFNYISLHQTKPNSTTTSAMQLKAIAQQNLPRPTPKIQKIFMYAD